MKKLVFFDVDGTLLSYSTNPCHIPEPTLQALELLKANGHIVSLATGRSFATAHQLMDELGIENAVLCGGAHIISQRKTILAHYIEPSLAESVARHAAQSGCAVFACSEDHIYTYNATEETLNYIREQSGREDTAKSIDQMKDVCLMNIYGTDLPDKMLLSPAHVTMDTRSIEMRPEGISKAHGIQFLAAYFGIPMEDTLAFGDGNNDIEMLEAAGISVAVGNGTDKAKRAADIVSDPIDDGGILSALKQLGLL